MHREAAQQYDCSITSNLHLAIAFQKPDNDWRIAMSRLVDVRHDDQVHTNRRHKLTE